MYIILFPQAEREDMDYILFSERSGICMNAVHTLWNLPEGFDKNEEYSVLTMILSALMWRRHNGEITLVTDTKGKEAILKAGLGYVWNNINTELDNIPEEINPQVFWAAGKIYGLKNIKSPVVSIDTDFVVWKPLELEKLKSDICVIHRETLSRDIYPDVKPYTDFDDGFSWETLPCNTAFFYVNNNLFLKEYLSYADRFMRACREEDCLKPMVFAEQRLFSMIAEKMKIRIDTFSSVENLMSGNDDRFTHLWGYKSHLRKNPCEKEEFTERLRNRLRKEFPDSFGKYTERM